MASGMEDSPLAKCPRLVDREDGVLPSMLLRNHFCKLAGNKRPLEFSLESSVWESRIELVCLSIYRCIVRSVSLNVLRLCFLHTPTLFGH